MSLLLASTLAALAIGEVVVRGVYPELAWRPFRDDFLGWSGRSYKRFDPLRKPKAERRRLLFLGDSFLAGAGVWDLEQRFPRVLARDLRPDLDVVILATGAWGTDQELLAFMQKGKAWQPDAVVVAFCATNDISNILSKGRVGRGRKPYFVTEEEGGLRLFAHDGQLITDWGRRLGPEPVWQLYLWDLLRLRLSSLSLADVEPSSAVHPRYVFFGVSERVQEIYDLQPKLSWSPERGVNYVSAFIHEDFAINAYQWQLFTAILARLKTEADEVGAEVMVMLLPAAFKVRDLSFVAGSSLVHWFETPTGGFHFRMDEPRSRLHRASEAADVRFFDPTPEFIARIEREGLLEAAWPWLHDRHFAPPAHRILAEQLAVYLESELGWEAPDRRARD
jgi:lysophospholipase L1-like esterase